jgi:hypothetical protein
MTLLPPLLPTLTYFTDLTCLGITFPAMAITQGSNGGQTSTAANEASAFEAERNRLITNIQIVNSFLIF